MRRSIITAFSAVSFLSAALAQGSGHGAHNAPEFKLPPDPRTAIEFPADVREFFKYEMRGHLEQLNTLMARLAEEDLAAAAGFARNGLAVMGNHPPGAPNPGRFAPPEFRAMGQAMHQAAAEVAKVAGAAAKPPSVADWKAVTTAVSSLTAACAGCHGAFRVK